MGKYTKFVKTRTECRIKEDPRTNKSYRPSLV